MSYISFGTSIIPRRIENDGYVNKVHCGLCEMVNVEKYYAKYEGGSNFLYDIADTICFYPTVQNNATKPSFLKEFHKDQ